MEAQITTIFQRIYQMVRNMLTYSNLLSKDPIYYVYVHKTLDGVVFYVGKGSGRRYKETRKRNERWMQAASDGYLCEIICDQMTEEEALIEEMITIYRLHKIGQAFANISTGGTGFTSIPNTVATAIKKSQAVSDAWKDGRFIRKCYAGTQNPFWGKRHTNEVRTKLREDRGIEIRCTNMLTMNSYIALGTRHAEEITGIWRQTLCRALKSGKPTKTPVSWLFERVSQ